VAPPSRHPLLKTLAALLTDGGLFVPSGARKAMSLSTCAPLIIDLDGIAGNALTAILELEHIMTAETRKSRPTVAENAKLRICPNCGGPAERKSARGSAPTFCSHQCKREKNNRDIARGAAIVSLAQAWRIDRGTGEIAKGAFAEVCNILDAFNAEDRDAGRPRADLYAAKLLSTGTRYMDRRRG